MPHNMNMNNSTESILMSALSTLSPSSLSHLTHSLSSLFHRHTRRLASLLSSPILFSLTLRHLQSLSLHQKSLLIAKHLSTSLSLLNHSINKNTTAATPPPSHVKLRDLDAALLLLLLCEIHQHDHELLLHAPPSRWRVRVCSYFSDSVLRLSTFGDTLIEFIEFATRCRDFVGCGGGGEGAASVAAVVAMKSVEVSGGECVICKEEMEEGRDVCELPCGHLFHWKCVLRWLKKRSTCPCCRYRLPTDDVCREIERLMEEFARIGGGDCGDVQSTQDLSERLVMMNMICRGRMEHHSFLSQTFC